jgi:hypothetical protein
MWVTEMELKCKRVYKNKSYHMSILKDAELQQESQTSEEEDSLGGAYKI